MTRSLASVATVYQNTYTCPLHVTKASWNREAFSSVQFSSVAQSCPRFQQETSREETFQETQMEALRLFWPSLKRHKVLLPPCPVVHCNLQFSSVQFSRSVVSNSLWPHGLRRTRPPCPSSTPRVYSNSCALSQWCHTTISSSVVPFSSHF